MGPEFQLRLDHFKSNQNTWMDTTAVIYHTALEAFPEIRQYQELRDNIAAKGLVYVC